MKLLSLLACFLLTSSSPVVAAKEQLPPDTPVNTETGAILAIVCNEGFGTGFVVADNTVATALHVASLHNCRIGQNGRRIKLYVADTKHDFALMTTDTTGMAHIPYSCVRYNNKQHYFAFGFGDGRPMLQRLTGTKHREDGMRMLLGTLISGQSGGPVVDGKGVVHGINNASNYYWGLSWSAELADTPLCRR